jgi:thiol-disulfide isomerase/thioredoxin
VVLVDFWATGCKPCLSEMPELERLRQELKPQGMELLGVALDPDSELVDQFMSMAKLNWPVIYANTSAANMESPMTLKYGVKAIPFKMVIDRDGTLAATGYRLQDVRPTLERLLLVPEVPGAGVVAPTHSPEALAPTGLPD